MKCRITCSTVHFALIAALALLATPITATQASEKTQAVIDRICRSLEDYQFCNDVFSDNLPQPDTDNVGLTKIALVEVQKNASDTLTFIGSLIPGEKDPAQVQRYTICQTAYSNLVQSFDKAFEAFNQGNYKDMTAADRNTPRTQASCSTVFGKPDPLNERNRQMRILVEMAVITGSLLVN